MATATQTNAATAAIAVGYVLAVPLTVFVPGFLRMWRRRERALFATEQLGAALIAGGFAARHKWPAAGVNLAWLIGFAVLYTAEGRKRRRTSSDRQSQ
ncbi:MAG: hypothetical protein M3Z02_06970 [Actinomycetota bacterium]|nr:hypothetical protein [Actinomycetota bacterium]